MKDATHGLSALDDYITGEMTDAEAERFEEALFDAAGDDEALVFLDRVARLGARSASTGTFDCGITRAELDALVASGHRVQLLEYGPPGAYPIVPPGDVDLVVTRLDLKLFGVDRVDCEVHLEGFGHVKTLRDVKVDPTDGATYGCCDVNLYRLAYSAMQRSEHRIVVERSGRREVVAVYEGLPSGR